MFSHLHQFLLLCLIISDMLQEKLFSSKNRTEVSLGKKLKIDMLPEIERVHKVLQLFSWSRQYCLYQCLDGSKLPVVSSTCSSQDVAVSSPYLSAIFFLFNCLIVTEEREAA